MPAKLLWIDCTGGIVVGGIFLAANSWLAVWLGLPQLQVLILGLANLSYGSCSLALAIRKRRPLELIRLLAVANVGWALICYGLVAWYWTQLSVFGVLHLVAEGVYVAVLGIVEWHYRHRLVLSGELRRASR
ncbi:MAG: hypothetical protein AAGA03_00155 [Planctomycetota bacterium]